MLSASSAAVAILIAAPLAPLAIATGRLGVAFLAAAAAGPASLWKAARRCAGRPGIGVRTALAGVFLGIHFACWISSLQLTTVVRSVVLVSTVPLFTGLLARAVGDRAGRGLYLGVAIAAAGTAVMVSGAPDAGAGGGASLRGDALALAAAAACALYLLIGRSVKEILPLRGYFALVQLSAGLTVALVALAAGTTWLAEGAGRTELLAVLYLGLVPGAIGHGLFNWAVRHVPAHTVSVVLLIEPVGAALLAWLILGRTPLGQEAAGAAAVLLGAWVGLRRSAA